MKYSFSLPTLPWQVARFLACGFLLAAAGYAPTEGAEDRERSGKDILENRDEIELKRREWFDGQRAFPAAGVPEGAKLRVWETLRAEAYAAGNRQLAALAAGPWVNIGPSQQMLNGLAYSNRIEHLAADPGNASHWLISTPGGGLWETADAGATWTPRTDDMPSLATGAVAFAPSNSLIVYSGIGEPGAGGLLKSTDGGATWQLMATAVFTSGDGFAEIRVHPTNPSTLYVATWSFFGIASTGIWRSTDGGTTWTHQLTGRAMDLEIDPGNVNHQYAILGGGYANPEDGVYRFDGASWTRLSGPWGALTGNSGALAIAPTNANVLYVSIRDKGIWKTTNAWAGTPTWTAVVSPPEFVSALVVDRADTNALWGGGVSMYRFDGAAWTELTRADQPNGLHVDQRYLAWAGTRLLVGNDGGIFSTLDGAAHWLDHNTNISISQFYSGSLHPTNANVAMGGTQDDGTARWTGAGPWSTTTWGDGMSSFFSASSPDSMWVTSVYYLFLYRTRNGGASYEQIDAGIDPSSRPFFGKIERCPANENIVLAGSHALWKSTDLFTATTPTWSLNGPEMNDAINALAFAPSSGSCQTYAYGNWNGELRITSTGGAAWADLDPNHMVPTRVITALAFHPTDPNTLYVTLSGYDENTPGQPGHLFKTTNALSGSPTWVNLSAPGTNVPYDAVVLDPLNPSVVYVGTDLGVWKSSDAGASWLHMGPQMGMPHSIVNDLRFNRTTNTLAAFTYGRDALLLSGGSGAVPSSTVGGGSPLLVTKAAGNTLHLTWGASCLPGDADYEVYAGTIGNYYSHTRNLCTTARATNVTLPAPSVNTYYLVVPTTTLREGSYGIRSNGSERPQGASPCLPQAVAAGCP